MTSDLESIESFVCCQCGARKLARYYTAKLFDGAAGDFGLCTFEVKGQKHDGVHGGLCIDCQAARERPDVPKAFRALDGLNPSEFPPC